MVQNRTVGGYAQSGYVGQPGSPGYRPPSIRSSSPAASYRPPSVGSIRPPSGGYSAGYRAPTPVGMSAQRSFNVNQPVVQYRPPSVGAGVRPPSVGAGVGTINYNVPPPVHSNISLFQISFYIRYLSVTSFHKIQKKITFTDQSEVIIFCVSVTVSSTILFIFVLAESISFIHTSYP